MPLDTLWINWNLIHFAFHQVQYRIPEQNEMITYLPTLRSSWGSGGRRNQNCAPFEIVRACAQHFKRSSFSFTKQVLEKNVVLAKPHYVHVRCGGVWKVEQFKVVFEFYHLNLLTEQSGVHTDRSGVHMSAQSGGWSPPKDM